MSGFKTKNKTKLQYQEVIDEYAFTIHEISQNNAILSVLTESKFHAFVINAVNSNPFQSFCKIYTTCLGDTIVWVKVKSGSGGYWLINGKKVIYK